ncbi:MAG: hypothetical protein HFI09_01225 [Bacilli bacterium]|nr:hypothetical protein [Bacilli bacterium]
MKIFIGCSSRNEIDSDYFELARRVGRSLLQHELIIGGTRNGMMGEVARVFDDEKVTQIILKAYVSDEMCNDHVMICDTSFLRMNLIWSQADCFLFLPGGTGTLGEIITFLEENRAKEEKKRIIILNYNHYYDDLLRFIEKAKTELFSNEEILEGLLVIEDENELESLF